MHWGEKIQQSQADGQFWLWEGWSSRRRWQLMRLEMSECLRGRELQAAGTASANVSWPECSWPEQGAARRPVWLEGGERGRSRWGEQDPQSLLHHCKDFGFSSGGNWDHGGVWARESHDLTYLHRFPVAALLRRDFERGRWHKGDKGRSSQVYLGGYWENAGGEGGILGHSGGSGDAGSGDVSYIFGRYSQQLINLGSQSTNICWEVFSMPAIALGMEIEWTRASLGVLWGKPEWVLFWTLKSEWVRTWDCLVWLPKREQKSEQGEDPTWKSGGRAFHCQQGCRCEGPRAGTSLACLKKEGVQWG